MKQMFTGVLLVLFSFGVFAGARIQFDRVNVDAGILHPNSREKIVFKFKNTGDATLEIRSVNAACGCTVPKLSKEEFAPGESGELVLWFYTAGYYGAVNKTATVLSNSELNPAITVSFDAVVKSELLPDKTKIEFRDVLPGKAVKKIVTIQNRMGRAAKLYDGKVLFGAEHLAETGFTWKVKKEKNKNLALVLGVKLKEKSTLNRPVRIKLAFKTNSKLDPKLIFYVTIKPIAPMVVTPASFFLPNISAGEKHIASVHLDSNGGRELAVDNVKMSNLPFSYQVETVSKTSATIWLNVNTTAPAGRIQGAIQVFTTVGSTPQMRIIPVKGQVR